jgi:hypothetical protein
MERLGCRNILVKMKKLAYSAVEVESIEVEIINGPQ